MKSIRTAAALATLVLAVAGMGAACSAQESGPAGSTPPATSAGGASGSAEPSASAAPTPGEGAVGPEEAAVEAALRAYQAALAAGDFVTACGLNTPETSVQIVAAVQAAGGQVATCEEALTAVFGQPGARETAAEAAATTTVQDVTVNGLNATISWTSERQGQVRSDEVTLQSVGGVWRLSGTA